MSAFNCLLLHMPYIPKHCHCLHVCTSHRYYFSFLAHCFSKEGAQIDNMMMMVWRNLLQSGGSEGRWEVTSPCCILLASAELEMQKTCILHPASSIQLTCSLHTEHSTAVLLGALWVESRGGNEPSRSWDGDSKVVRDLCVNA